MNALDSGGVVVYNNFIRQRIEQVVCFNTQDTRATHKIIFVGPAPTLNRSLLILCRIS